jgi:hypothetical protein
MTDQGDNFESDVGQPILAAPDLSRSGTGRLESRLQAGLRAPRLSLGYSQDSKMPMSRYRVYSADYRNSAAPEGEPQEG